MTLVRLFDLPLGARFRYRSGDTRVYVLLSYADCGLVADEPKGATRRPFQGLYSAADSRRAFEELEVIPMYVVGLTEDPSKGQ